MLIRRSSTFLVDLQHVFLPFNISSEDLHVKGTYGQMIFTTQDNILHSRSCVDDLSWANHGKSLRSSSHGRHDDADTENALFFLAATWGPLTQPLKKKNNMELLICTTYVLIFHTYTHSICSVCMCM